MYVHSWTFATAIGSRTALGRSPLNGLCVFSMQLTLKYLGVNEDATVYSCNVPFLYTIVLRLTPVRTYIDT